MCKLESYTWYNLAGIDRSTSWIRNEAESLTVYVRNLSEIAPTPEGKASIDKAVNALTEALLAAKLAQSAYGKSFAEAAE
jgi:hypothetical protein